MGKKTRCELKSEARLEEVLARASQISPAVDRQLQQEIWQISQAESQIHFAEDQDLAKREIQHRKWQLIQKYIHDRPYRDKLSAIRSQQWRDVLNRFRALRDRELLDWIALQVEVAENLEAGIHEMRPRKFGPTYFVLMEYVTNNKGKAKALLQWAQSAETDGVFKVASGWHSKTDEILRKYREENDLPEPEPTTDPYCKS